MSAPEGQRASSVRRAAVSSDVLGADALGVAVRTVVDAVLRVALREQQSVDASGLAQLQRYCRH